jgi:superfamily I DNA/RNA helicase/mRNA-degrading endonuclease RelE of RelBE toxin-antitoxin system
MAFHLADTFLDSLTRLTAAEQKQVKTTVFDLLTNPENPGMNFHRLDRAADKRFWSVRVGRDIRIIVHRDGESMLVCYVDHHDKAYAWVGRRKLETHPATGAAQIVEVREGVREDTAPSYAVREPTVAPYQPPATVPHGKAKAAIFAARSDDDLLGYGIPAEWLPEVRGATEDTILDIADHLPGEAAEALLELATGGTPRKARPARPSASPMDHPDAQRRFRSISDADELALALDFPWDKWTVFLHPAQRELVEREFTGPARVAGSAGTGKTIVALHRAAHLARANPESRVLLTTFSEPLAAALREKLRRLLAAEPRVLERIEVEPLNAVARHLYETRIGRPALVSHAQVVDFLLRASSDDAGSSFPLSFVASEWEQVVDAWQLRSWEAYRDVARLGRKTRLPEKRRQVLWAVFEAIEAELDARALITTAGMLRRITEHLAATGHLPYDFVVVDEAQDLSVAQLRFVAALGAGRDDSLFFAGDLGQRIFQLPFSWKSLAVDVRGRSSVLRVNYRTSHQIRAQADRLLGKEVSDIDGNVEERTGTVSVFNGPQPVVSVLKTEAEESSAVGRWLEELAGEGIGPEEMCVLVRSEAQVARALPAVEAADLESAVLDESLRTSKGCVAIATMHLSKGLEYRAVAVMACDDEVLPLQERIESVADDADLREVYDTERQLLYVACTRARDHLMISGVTPASEFLDDLADGITGSPESIIVERQGADYKK